MVQLVPNAPSSPRCVSPPPLSLGVGELGPPCGEGWMPLVVFEGNTWDSCEWLQKARQSHPRVNRPCLLGFGGAERRALRVSSAHLGP